MKHITPILFSAFCAATLLAQPPGRNLPSPGIDLSGMWVPALHEDSLERGAGSEIGDYGGFPLNEAGRLWALSYDPSRVTLRHHQCDGYALPYQMRALGNARGWEERDPHTQRLIAIHWWEQTFEGHRVIWMDGRPHPPAWAPHTWMGFSTGQFMGNALVIRTTHVKQGWLRRNGTPESDQATVDEFFVRHGDHITYTSSVNDPVFLAEPMVRTTDFYRLARDPNFWLFACDDGEQILDRKPDNVPHYQFGKNPFIMEYADRYKIPLLGQLGGAASMYPEFAAKLKTATAAEGQAATRPSGAVQTSKAANPDPTDGEIHAFPVRDHIFMLVGAGSNIVVQTGDEGTIVVDTGNGQLSDKVIAAIRRLSDRPIQFIANTSFRPDHTGGNVKLRAAGVDPSVQGSFFSLQFADAGVGATIVGHQNVQTRMVQLKMPSEGWPSDTSRRTPAYVPQQRRH